MYPRCAFCAKDVYDDELEDVGHERLKWHRNTCFRCGNCSLQLARGRPYIVVEEGILCMDCFVSTRNQNAESSWQEDVSVRYRTRRVQFNNNTVANVYSPSISTTDEEQLPQVADAPADSHQATDKQCFTPTAVNENGERCSSAVNPPSPAAMSGQFPVLRDTHDVVSPVASVNDGRNLRASPPPSENDDSAASKDLASSYAAGEENHAPTVLSSPRSPFWCGRSADRCSLNDSLNMGFDLGSPEEQPPPPRELTEHHTRDGARCSPRVRRLFTPSPPCFPTTDCQRLTPEVVARPETRVPLRHGDASTEPLGNCTPHEAASSRRSLFDCERSPRNSEKERSFKKAWLKFVGGEPLTPGQTKFICYGCKKQVYDTDYLSILNRAYHRSCFKCSRCPTRLQTKTFFDKNNEPYCQRCFKASAMAPTYNPSPAYDKGVQSEGNGAEPDHDQ